jgi:septal ring factor EnvC (AmiA/AmiB activator)
MTDYKPKERQDLEELYRKQNVRINQLEQENKKLKNSIEYRKKKADKNQEKADFIDKIMKLP